VASDSYFLVLETPGARRDSVEVKAGPVAGSISVSVRIDPPRGVAGDWLRSETGARGSARSVSRILPVGWDADIERATTEVENGLLVVSIPRRRAAPREGAPQA